MVSQLIAKMVGDGDDPSAEEAETIIKNVATVTVEGAFRTCIHRSLLTWTILYLGGADTVHSLSFRIFWPC